MSGIYIPGMEMPIACTFCPCAHDDKCDITRKKQTFLEWYESRPDWCPLVPVPDHGPLVDADAIVASCKDEKGYYYGYEAAIIGEKAESAPVIIPADPGREAST